MNLKSKKVQKYWGANHKKINYTQKDPSIIKEFLGTHPEVLIDWLPKSSGLFKVDPSYVLTSKERRHRMMIKLEIFFGLELSKKHFKLV